MKRKPLKGRVGTERGGIYYGFFNPQVIQEYPAVDTDTVSPLNYLHRVVEENINPNILKRLGGSDFIAYVVKYNKGSSGELKFQCAKGPQAKGLNIDTKDDGPNYVNALIIELNPAYPTPPALDRKQVAGETEADPNPCKDLAILNSERIATMAPRFIIPKYITEPLRAGNLIRVRLTDPTTPSQGGLVTDIVRTENKEALLAPLIDGSRSRIKDIFKQCEKSADFTVPPPEGDNPTPPIPPTPVPNPKKIVVGSLVIDRMDKKLSNPQGYTERTKPLSTGGALGRTHSGTKAIVIVYSDTTHEVSQYDTFHYVVEPDGSVTEWLDPSLYVTLNSKSEEDNQYIISVNLVNSSSQVVINKAKQLLTYLTAKYKIPTQLIDPRLDGRLMSIHNMLQNEELLRVGFLSPTRMLGHAWKTLSSDISSDIKISDLLPTDNQIRKMEGLLIQEDRGALAPGDNAGFA